MRKSAGLVEASKEGYRDLLQHKFRKLWSEGIRIPWRVIGGSELDAGGIQIGSFSVKPTSTSDGQVASREVG